MIKNSQRTIYGMSLQMHALTGKPYKVLPNTTLNEKFNINKGVLNEDNEYPTLKYYTIGVGGSGILDTVDGYNYSKHRATDAALFEHLPFVVRRTDNDLLPQEQVRYRFKMKKIINNIEYYCYYLRVIENESIKDEFHEINMVNGVPVLSLFDTNTDKLLSPTPKENTVMYSNTDDVKYITKVTKIPFIMLKTDLLEVQNAINVLYGYGTTKALTEIGVCTGIDKTIDGILDATVVQIAFHYEVDVDTASTLAAEKELIRSIEIAGMEPLTI